jgi:hypothetical protein
MLGGDPHGAEGAGLRFLLRSLVDPPTEVLVSVGGERDCVLDSEEGPVVRFFERGGRLFVEPAGTASGGVRRNGRRVDGAAEVRDLDRIDCGPDRAFEVLLDAARGGHIPPGDLHSKAHAGNTPATPGARRLWIPWVLCALAVGWGITRGSGPNPDPQVQSARLAPPSVQLPEAISSTTPAPSPTPAPPPVIDPAPQPVPAAIPAFRADESGVVLMPAGPVVAPAEWWMQAGAEVGSLALNARGDLLAVGCGDGRIILLNASDGQTVRAWAAHTDSIAALAWIPGTPYLLTAGYDGRAILWDASTGWKIRTLTEGPGALRSAAVSPDGHTVAVGSASGTITVWDAPSGHEWKWWPGHTGMVNALAFSPDGAVLASGSADRSVRVWECRDWHRVHDLRPHEGGVNAVAFIDSKLLLTGADNFGPGSRGTLRPLNGPSAALVDLGHASGKPRMLDVRAWVLAVGGIPATGRLLVGTGGAASSAFEPVPGRLLIIDARSGRAVDAVELAPRGVSAVAGGHADAVFVGGLDGWVRRAAVASDAVP